MDKSKSKSILVKSVISVLLIMPIVIILIYSKEAIKKSIEGVNVFNVRISQAFLENPSGINLIVWTLFFGFVLLSSVTIIFSMVTKVLEKKDLEIEEEE